MNAIAATSAIIGSGFEVYGKNCHCLFIATVVAGQMMEPRYADFIG